MSNKSMFKRFAKPKAPEVKPPRTIEEINREYTELAKLLGDRTVKAEGLKKEINDILNKIDSLGSELNARLKIDAEEKAKQPSEGVKDADAGVTTPVGA